MRQIQKHSPPCCSRIIVFYSGDPWNATIGTIAKTTFQELKESNQTSQNLKNVIWDEHRWKNESCYLRRHLSNQLSWKMGLLKCLFFLDKYRFQSKTFATVLLTRESLGREATCWLGSDYLGLDHSRNNDMPTSKTDWCLGIECNDI